MTGDQHGHTTYCLHLMLVPIPEFYPIAAATHRSETDFLLTEKSSHGLYASTVPPPKNRGESKPSTRRCTKRAPRPVGKPSHLWKERTAKSGWQSSRLIADVATMAEMSRRVCQLPDRWWKPRGQSFPRCTSWHQVSGYFAPLKLLWPGMANRWCVLPANKKGKKKKSCNSQLGTPTNEQKLVTRLVFPFFFLSVMVFVYNLAELCENCWKHGTRKKGPCDSTHL